MPVIKYDLDIPSLKTNREIYINENIKNDDANISRPMLFWEFLNIFLYADIVIYELDDCKSISLEGGLLSFIYQLYNLLSEFERNKKTSGFVLGSEQGQFSLELKKEKEKLVIVNRNKIYSTDFSSMFIEVKLVYKKIIEFELNKLKFIREDDCFTTFIENFSDQT